MRLFMISCLIAIALPLQVHSATIHVPADQPTIQAGINAAAFAGDTVLVAPGTYTGLDNKDLNLKGKAIVLRSEEGADSTIIDCENQGRGFYFQAGEGQSTVVEGFTIRFGSVGGPFPNGWGGGVLCIGSSPTIRGCVIASNGASDGGGIACYDSSPRIVDCTLQENTSIGGSGGAAYILESSPRFESCSLESNFATFGGGGLHADASSPTLVGCQFTQNSVSSGDGGGAYFNTSSGMMANCDLVGNRGRYGGGMYVVGEATPSFTVCTISQNIADSRGGGIYSVSGSPSIDDCIIESNSASIGGGIYISSATSLPAVTGTLLIDNYAFLGGAVASDQFGSPLLFHCLFVANRGGAVLSTTQGGRARLRNCTLYGNLGGIAIAASSDTVFVENSIIAFAPSGEVAECAGGVVTLTCTDIYANLGGNWTGCIASQLGQNGNFSANPLFCNATDHDFTIRATSPCAPANSPPGCGLIGALPVGCGVAGVDAEEAPSADLRLTVIPNPVRGAARFELGPVTPAAILRIFDSQGRLVDQVIGQDGHWEWMPGSAVPAGVYFARPEAEVDGLEAVKFLYVR